MIPFADGGRLAGKPQDYLRVEAGLRSNLTDVVLICGKLPAGPALPNHQVVLARVPVPQPAVGHPDNLKGTRAGTAGQEHHTHVTASLQCSSTTAGMDARKFLSQAKRSGPSCISYV